MSALATLGSGTLHTHRIELAPGTDPLAIWGSSTDEHRTFFARSGFSIAALGAAAVIEVERGLDPFPILSAARGELAESIALGAGANPLLVGGAAFGTTPSGRGPAWDNFPGARLVLPELLVINRNGRSWAVLTSPDPSGHWTPTVTELAGDAVDPTVPAPFDQSHFDDDDDYVDLVGRGIAAIGDGTFDKVVLARAAHLAGWGEPGQLLRSLDRLRAAYADCATFAIGAGDQTFFGATPERLVGRWHDELRIAALAGSAPRGLDPAGDAALRAGLLGSHKDRAEHDFVVRYIRRRLAEIGVAIEDPGAPEVMQLRNIQHLHTPIRAAAPTDVDLLSMAGALHPTPAVAGTPTDAAVAWLDAHEHFDRGWYAAPVGWCDLAGDGEFRVGLRSALVDADGAHLFAGAGVVSESDPHRELAETAVKLRALADLLHP